MAKYMEDTTFDLLTGQLDWSDAEGGHEPDKTAALVELVNGEPSFIAWYKPEFLPEP
jgi:branched-chain amino acid transport system substrate-binding protein